MLINVAIPGDRNVINKEAEIILEYKVRVEYKNKCGNSDNRGDWNHFKALRQYLSNIPGKHDINGMQKQPYWSPHTYCRKC